MPKEERFGRQALNLQGPLDVSKIPNNQVREVVSKLRTLNTAEDWRREVGDWFESPTYINTAIFARSLGQAERNRGLPEMFKRFSTRGFDEGSNNYVPHAFKLVALFCLSDDQLDIAISAFQETRH